MSHPLDDKELVRKFDTGATRSPDAGRYDPEGFDSPIVDERYAEYMQKNRIQSYVSVRSSDNWQKGIPLDSYIKGLCRHVLHARTRHRGFKVMDPKAAADLEEDLCAILFNAKGYLFELLKDKRRAEAVRTEGENKKPEGPPNETIPSLHAWLRVY